MLRLREQCQSIVFTVPLVVVVVLIFGAKSVREASVCACVCGLWSSFVGSSSRWMDGWMAWTLGQPDGWMGGQVKGWMRTYKFVSMETAAQGGPGTRLDRVGKAKGHQWTNTHSLTHAGAGHEREGEQVPDSDPDPAQFNNTLTHR